MDGNNVDTSPLHRVAAYVRQAAIAAGYDIDRVNSGAKARLAADAGMSASSLSRLLSAQRMPSPEYFIPLATALKVSPLELLAQASENPTVETPSQEPHRQVPSQPLTPDDVADAWKVDAFGREMVHAMFERLTRPHVAPADNGDEVGGAEAQ